MTENEVIALAVAHKLGRTMKPLGMQTGDVFVTDQSYRTGELLAFARAVEAAERERWIAKAGAAYTDAHAIFNDPPSETAQEVRDVIEWHLATMRA